MTNRDYRDAESIITRLHTLIVLLPVIQRAGADKNAFVLALPGKL
jgi:hypothetical protein